MIEPTRNFENEVEDVGYKSPLEQARENWGQASVIGNDLDIANNQERGGLEKREPRAANRTGTASAVANQEKANVAAAGGLDTSTIKYSGGPKSKTIDNASVKKSKSARAVNFLTKRPGIGLLAGGGGIAGILVAGFMAAQPFQIVHFAQVLNQFHFFGQEDTGDSRNGRLMQYFRKHPSRGNQGILANKLTDRFEKKLTDTGVEFDFTHPDNPNQNMATVQRMKVDLDNPKSQKVIADLKQRGVDVGADGTVKLRGSGSSKAARQAIRSTVREAGYGKISGAVRSRMLIKRAGVKFSPMNNFLREKGESLNDYRKKKRDQRAKDTKSGETNKTPGAKGEADVDEDGKPVSNPENDRLAAEVNESVGGAEADVKAETSKLRGKVTKSVGVGAGLVALACIARDVNSQAEKLQYANVVLPLMRFAWEFKSVASQIMFGQQVVNGQPSFNMDEVSEMTDRLSEVVEKIELDNNDQPIRTGKTHISTWQQAESIRAEQGEDGGLPPEEIIKPGDNAKKVPFTAWIDSIPGIGAACSTAGGFIISAVEIVAGIVTGGGATAVSQAIKSAILQGGMEAAGIDPLGTFIEWIARKVVGAEIDTLKKGANAGNMANYGELLAANNVAIGSGGTKLTTAETRELDKEKNIAMRIELKNKSFFARMLDLKEPNSVASFALLRSGNFISKESTIAWGKKLPLASLTAPSANIAQAFTQKTYASSNYDYGFSEYGFTQAELDSEEYEDPYANAEVVEQNIHGKGGKWDEDYSDCFGVEILENGSIEIADKSYYEIPDKCADRSNKELTRYRFYLLDSLTVRSMECYEGVDEAACSELGFDRSSSSNQTITPGQVSEDTSATPCAANTDDLGIREDAYADGKPIRIRLCGLNSIAGPGLGNKSNAEVGTGKPMVSSIFSESWQKLGEAFEAENGRKLAVGSSWRTMAHQQDLCTNDKANGGSGNCPGGDYTDVAQPGHSNHQAGAAMDISDIWDSVDGLAERGKECSNAAKSSHATYGWMKANASKFGIKQYKAEAWHWGGLEQC